MTTLHPAVEQALALVDFKRYDQARALLSQHLVEDPGDTRAWIELGYCHLKMQQPEQALEAADEALKIAPEDFYVLILRAKALTSGPNSSWRAAEPVLREAVRADPQHWYGYTMLADAVCRMSMVRYFQANGSRKPEPHEVDLVYREAADLASEALRLGPEEVYAHEIAHQIATFSGDIARADQLERAILRLDPTHTEALAAQTRRAAEAPGVKAPAPPTSTPPGLPPHRTPPSCSAVSTRPRTACCAACGGLLCSASASPGRGWTCSPSRARCSGSCRCHSASACGTSCR
ncbi:tetratricopeptide repeat protein [Streptomyces lydicamycinicus]|uniref:tetratricopeptide repeat protein n=1 Tax=Streptomyces lydicamycinicus TaxID=1546107 RepID=UPI00203644F9|nr:tetratricopeptide repeat protein [Streptomyces lydicamycinicus]USA00563.1 tetratricopeptide repeat protein [Streptomyces lydicamycinicus]